MKISNKITLAAAMLLTGGTHLFSQALISKQDEKTELYGLVDEDDKWVVQPKYKEIDFKLKAQGLTYVKDTKDKIGFINDKGQEVVHCQFDDYREEKGYYFVEKKITDTESLHGLLDSTGKEILPAKYGWIDNTIKQGGFVLQDNESYHYGVIDAQGKILIPFTLPYIKYIYKGVLIAQEENPGLQGLLDLKNNWIIPCTYDVIKPFSETNDLALTAKGGKAGFINLSGKIIIPLDYDGALDENGSLSDYSYGFLNDYAPVKKNGKWGVINTSNKVIIPFDYDELTRQDGTKYTFKQKGKPVIVDAKAK